jgi:hypothetical protein
VLLFLFFFNSWRLDKIISDGLCTAYVDWSRGHITNEICCVRLAGVSSSPFIALSGVPQCSDLGPSLFNK